MQHLGVGEFLGELGLQRGEGVGFHEVGFVDDDEVGFLELFAVDINDLLRKLAAFAQAEHARRAHRIDQHAQRRDAEVLAVNAPKRIGDRRHEVGAAADRLGNEHIRPRALGEFTGGIDQ